MSSYSVPGSVVGTGDTVLKNIQGPVFMEFMVSWET